MVAASPFTVTEQDRVSVIRLGSEFASIYEPDLVKLAPLLDLAESVSPPYLVFDLTGTKYFGSAFIGFLISIANRMAARGVGRFAVCGLAAFGKMALETTKSTMLMELFDTADEAVSAIRLARQE